MEELKEYIVVKTIPAFEGNWSQFDDDMEVEVPNVDVFWVFLDLSDIEVPEFLTLFTLWRMKKMHQ